MEPKCVIGNCEEPWNSVKRCYWSVGVAKWRPGGIESHAYMDLCSFHQGMFESHSCASWVPGWDAI